MCKCGHSIGWHLFSDGPHPLICNKPKCKCGQYEAVDE